MFLELKNIVKEYDSPSGTEILKVLKGINLQVAEEDSLAIVGPSGSGKSTLLNIIGALDKPTSGTVNLAGKELSGLNDRDLAHIRNKEIGFVFQLHHLLPQCTVLENVLVPTIPLKASKNSGDKEKRAKLLLERVSLRDHFFHRPAQLSGGELQRVAVVRALINQPKLLLADEPTGSLDQASSDDLVRLLVELNKEEKVTLIVVTHSLELARRLDRIYRLNDGILEISSS